jgi:hypothetical protein
MSVTLQIVPPFEKVGPGGILKSRTEKSPSIPLFQRGKWNSPSRAATQSSFRRKPESRVLAGKPENKMDTGLRRYDWQRSGAE